MPPNHRDRLAATLLNITGQAIAITAAAILGHTAYQATAGHGLWTIATAAITSLGTLLTTSTFADNLLGPTIDRLRSTDTTETDQ